MQAPAQLAPCPVGVLSVSCPWIAQACALCCLWESAGRPLADEFPCIGGGPQKPGVPAAPGRCEYWQAAAPSKKERGSDIHTRRSIQTLQSWTDCRSGASEPLFRSTPDQYPGSNARIQTSRWRVPRMIGLCPFGVLGFCGRASHSVLGNLRNWVPWWTLSNQDQSRNSPDPMAIL